MSNAMQQILHWGVVPAGGSGERFQASLAELPCERQGGLMADKLMCVLPDVSRSVLGQSVWSLLTLVPCERVMIATHPETLSVYQDRLGKDLSLDLYTRIDWTEGGATRRESVFKALQAILEQNHLLNVTTTKSNNTNALRAWVHDGARPWLGEALVNRLREGLIQPQVKGVLPGLAVTDTVKVVNEQGQVESTLDRNRCVAVQTPQVFDWDVLMQAHQEVDAILQATDDAQLVELWLAQSGSEGVIQTVIGDPANQKITHAGDLF